MASATRPFLDLTPEWLMIQHMKLDDLWFTFSLLLLSLLAYIYGISVVFGANLISTSLAFKLMISTIRLGGFSTKAKDAFDLKISKSCIHGGL